MNRTIVVLLVVMAIFSGCSSKYVVTLSNGARVSTTTKPRLKDGYYHFKDANGRDTVVSTGRVREIAPASMAEEEKSRFQTKPQK